MNGSTLVLRSHSHYSCRGRVMTSQEVEEWEKGVPIEVGYDTLYFDHSPRAIKDFEKIYSQYRKRMIRNDTERIENDTKQ